MLLLALLFTHCIINALSRYISQQVQWSNSSSLSRKSHLCLHTSPPSSSISIPLKPTGQPLRWVPLHLPLPFPPHCQQEAARWDAAPFLQQQLGVHLRMGTCWIWGGQRTKIGECPIPHKSTVSPTSCKVTCNFTSHGCLRMPQNATGPINRRLSQDCVYVPADMSKDHSTPDPWLSYLTKRTKFKKPSL
jgi:hypothetical protein